MSEKEKPYVVIVRHGQFGSRIYGEYETEEQARDVAKTVDGIVSIVPTRLKGVKHD